jgi:hypothetical protein
MFDKIQKYSILLIILFSFGAFLKNKQLCKVDFILISLIGLSFLIYFINDIVYENKVEQFNIFKRKLNPKKLISKVGSTVKKAVPKAVQKVIPKAVQKAVQKVIPSNKKTSETTVPETTEPEIMPETTIPETTMPETTMPETTMPETTIPTTTIPTTTVPTTTVPTTTVPTTTVQRTTVPTTTVPTTSVFSNITGANTTYLPTGSSNYAEFKPTTTGSLGTSSTTGSPGTSSTKGSFGTSSTTGPVATQNKSNTNLDTWQRVLSQKDTPKKDDIDVLIKKGLVQKYDFLNNLAYQNENPLYYINSGDLVDNSFDNPYTLVDSKHWKPHRAKPPVCVNKDAPCEPCAINSHVPYLDVTKFNVKATV